MRLWCLIAAMGLGMQVASADVLYLADGNRMEGTILRESGGWVVTEASGKVTHVKDANVRSVEKSSNLTPAQIADSKLTMLRRSVESLSDPAQAVDRYSRFIEQNKETSAAAAAKKELDIWKVRQARKMTKVGEVWMTAEEQAELAEKSGPLVAEARTHLEQGRLRQAAEQLDKVLAQDPNNVPGLYLRGLAFYKQKQLGLAKKNLEQVRLQLKTHAPTLNNLAIILWQQKQYPEALAMYEQAMGAAAQNRQILDNVIEALHALPNDEKNSAAAKRVAKRFEEEDALLQKRLEQEGLYRWGSSFVPKDRMEELKRNQQRIKTRVDALRADQRKMESRILEINQLSKNNEDMIDQMNQDRKYYDPVDKKVRNSRLPSMYWDLKRDNERMKLERQELLAKLNGFNERIRAVESELPVPPYSGTQRLIETEGTPQTAAGPATRPAETQPG